jgi:uncharacterized protein
MSETEKPEEYPTEGYDCLNCPSYCCTYPRIVVTKKDIARLAKHYGLSDKAAKEKFTRKGEDPGERILLRQEDEHYSTACKFMDPEGRHCTIYEARPEICREYPGLDRCGYYDFLQFERLAFEDEDHVAITNNEEF